MSEAEASEAEPVPVTIALSEDARLLIEFSQMARRLGRLEIAIPQAYLSLRDAPAEKMHGLIDHVFTLLFDHLKN